MHVVSTPSEMESKKKLLQSSDKGYRRDTTHCGSKAPHCWCSVKAFAYFQINFSLLGLQVSAKQQVSPLNSPL